MIYDRNGKSWFTYLLYKPSQGLCRMYINHDFPFPNVNVNFVITLAKYLLSTNSYGKMNHVNLTKVMILLKPQQSTIKSCAYLIRHAVYIVLPDWYCNQTLDKFAIIATRSEAYRPLQSGHICYLVSRQLSNFCGFRSVLSIRFQYGVKSVPKPREIEIKHKDRMDKKLRPRFAPYSKTVLYKDYTLQRLHNGRDRVSNHQPHDCLLNRLFRCKSN